MPQNDAPQGPQKKPYVRPVLECASVYEAAAATCCKVTNALCKNTARNNLGKDQARSVVS
ncbi:MAG: hypothetical protein WC713_03175 [Candidatus Methylomirabilota bacterium]